MLIPPCAAAQGGAFSRRQALAAGLSAATIKRRLDRGTWSQWMPNGYAVTGVQPPLKGRIAVALDIVPSVASHLSAAHLHGVEQLLSLPPSLVVHVTSHRRRHENVAGLHEHRLVLRDDEIVLVDGLRTTTLTRTVLDLMAWLPERPARDLFFRCIQTDLLDAARLTTALTRWQGRHGVRRLRTFLAYLGTGAHSGGERELHQVLLAAGVEFTANVVVALPGGGTAVVDVLIDGTRIVLELDGRAHHSSPEAFQRDRTRQNALVAAGFTVLRFTVPDVVDRPHSVIAAIRRQQQRA